VTIADRLKSDVSAALKAGDRDRVGALRFVLSELQKAAKDGPPDELAILRRERKRRLDSARQYADAGRDELAEAERREVELIESYLPAELPDAELREIVARAIRDADAQSARDMGKVMSLAMPAVDGRADGKRVSATVREQLGA
jgi:uncharacterized protein YqeY